MLENVNVCTKLHCLFKKFCSKINMSRFKNLLTFVRLYNSEEYTIRYTYNILERFV